MRMLPAVILLPAISLNQKYEVIQAGSGKEGLIYAWRDRPDLAVIDPTITDITGEELARKLKQDPRTANMPLIALSGDPSAARVRSCLDAGFSDYIPKSGQAMSTLIETASRLLGVSGMAVKQGGFADGFPKRKGRNRYFIHLCKYCHEYRGQTSLRRVWSLWIWCCPSAPSPPLSAMRVRRILSRSPKCLPERPLLKFFRDGLR